MRYVLSNVGKVYDGTSASDQAIHRGVDLTIDRGRVESLRPHDPSLKSSEAQSVIDASSYTVTPGLIDCHGHVTALGLSEESMDVMNSQTALLFVEKILYTTLCDGGVTTVRDVGGATHRMKRLVEEGIIMGPRLKVAVGMLSTTGGHADFRGPDRCHATISKLWAEGPGRPSSIVDGPWECRKRVRELAACGADLIKICASPGVASPSDKLEHQDFSEEEIRAICSEAEARGLRVAAHAHSRNGIDMAIRCGVHDIQHISFLDEPLAEAAEKNDCTVTPTSWIMHELMGREDLSPFVKEKVKQVAEVHARATELAVNGGLRILGGTDPVLPGMHGKNYLELHYLIQEGLSPLAAWYGSTGLAATEIGADETGCLRENARADLLVCQEDVVDNPARIGNGALVEVIKDGEGYRGGLAKVPQRGFGTGLRRLLENEGRAPET